MQKCDRCDCEMYDTNLYKECDICGVVLCNEFNKVWDEHGKRMTEICENDDGLVVCLDCQD